MSEKYFNLILKTQRKLHLEGALCGVDRQRCDSVGEQTSVFFLLRICGTTALCFKWNETITYLYFIFVASLDGLVWGFKLFTITRSARRCWLKKQFVTTIYPVPVTGTASAEPQWRVAGGHNAEAHRTHKWRSGSLVRFLKISLGARPLQDVLKMFKVSALRQFYPFATPSIW